MSQLFVTSGKVRWIGNRTSMVSLILVSSLILNWTTLLDSATLAKERRRIRGTTSNSRKNIHSSFGPTTTPSTNDLYDQETKRLLRLESANPVSYLYRYRAPRTTISSPTAQTLKQDSILVHHQQPRVLLKLNGQSGIIGGRRKDVFVPVSTFPSPSLPSTPTPTPIPYEPNLIENVEAKVDKGDYLYHFYLDYPSSSSSLSKESLYPQPSEHLKPFSQHQNSIWKDFIKEGGGTEAPTTESLPTPFPQYLNEVHADNYTIPSLRHYKFPGFKTTTHKPPKIANYLNPYEYFSEEDFENVADLDGDHSKYFIKTKPREIPYSKNERIYESFYHEPPSYSTKIQPFPVKAIFPHGPTNNEKLNELGMNYRDGVVTFPSSETTPATSFTLMTTTTTTHGPYHYPRPNQSISILMHKQWEKNHTGEVPTEGFQLQKPDVSTAESIAIFASKSSSSNIIPDSFPETTTVAAALPKSSTEATSIPGMPGIDYPIFDEIPVTSFDCQKQRYKGFFADMVWHYCDFADGHSSFLCPNGTLFSQAILTCDWWFNVDCVQAQQLYVLNERLYRFIKPPKPSFPEDYHGPHVDLWLKKQLELGNLPKIKKKKGKPTTLREKVIPNKTKIDPPTPTLLMDSQESMQSEDSST